jgi:Na+-transporting NADH:ubiquinone oxidoreductase subunit C
VAADKDSIKNILIVSMTVCLVCAIVVSGSAVSLKPQREANKAADRSKNILIAAGLFEENKTSVSEVDELFSQFTIRLVDMDENRLLSAEEAKAQGIDLSSYDQRKASKDPKLSRELSSAEDIASISRRARYSVAYMLIKDGEIDRIVLPIHGYGLWSTMYGFIALEQDLNTVAGITFYEQQETAGLGGEVDNAAWKAQWRGKHIYDADGKVTLRVSKVAAAPGARRCTTLTRSPALP